MDMITANTSIMGARTAIRMHIMNAFWMLVTSVVQAGTSEDVEKRSIFAKEKLAPDNRDHGAGFRKPAAASAANQPESAPKPSDSIAIMNSLRP